MKKYTLRILDGTSRGYTEKIICSGKNIGRSCYEFYNHINGEVKVTYVGYYPIDRTIIEKIEDIK